MEHLLTIPFGKSPDHPADDQIRVMARLDVTSFEDEGWPDLLKGKLIDVPARLIPRVRSGEPVLADVAGKTYRVAALSDDGEIELRKDQL
jgi:hypothetical protein